MDKTTWQRPYPISRMIAVYTSKFFAKLECFLGLNRVYDARFLAKWCVVRTLPNILLICLISISYAKKVFSK